MNILWSELSSNPAPDDSVDPNVTLVKCFNGEKMRKKTKRMEIEKTIAMNCLFNLNFVKASIPTAKAIPSIFPRDPEHMIPQQKSRQRVIYPILFAELGAFIIL
jgi:hypothetical protein